MPVQLPAPDQAYNTVFCNVFADTFFQKLASRGHAPQNEKQAQELLELSGKLEVLENDPAIKAAGDTGGIGQANTALDRYLAQNGLDGQFKQASQAEHDSLVSNYAAQLMQNPELYNAVLSLKAAEATKIAQQLA